MVGSNVALRALGWLPSHDLTQTIASVAAHWRAEASEPRVPGSSS